MSKSQNKQPYFINCTRARLGWIKIVSIGDPVSNFCGLKNPPTGYQFGTCFLLVRTPEQKMKYVGKSENANIRSICKIKKVTRFSL
jgi:hypothetical protein